MLITLRQPCAAKIGRNIRNMAASFHGGSILLNLIEVHHLKHAKNLLLGKTVISRFALPAWLHPPFARSKHTDGLFFFFFFPLLSAPQLCHKTSSYVKRPFRKRVVWKTFLENVNSSVVKTLFCSKQNCSELQTAQSIG